MTNPKDPESSWTPTEPTERFTPNSNNRERVTAPARIPGPSTDPRNEVLWRPTTEDPDLVPTDPPARLRMWRPGR